MKNKKRILVLPHIGTAYGHLVRSAEFINDYFKSDPSYDIYMAVSDSAIEFAKAHIPDDIIIIKRFVIATVNNKSGFLDIESFKKLVEEDSSLVLRVNPDIIISDPGIQAAILWYKFKKPWIGIVHGCYLPKPFLPNMDENLLELTNKLWMKIEYSLDTLIQIGTGRSDLTWKIAQKTGKLIVLNQFSNEPLSPHVEYYEKSITKIGWHNSTEVDLLVTCGSSGEVEPDDDFIERLKPYYQNITVAGSVNKKEANGITYIGNNFNFGSLVGDHTTVITHAGHGTLKAISKAKRVIMIPGDLDQLSNAIVAHIYKKWDIIYDRNWFEILNSPNPFYRKIFWNNICISLKGNIVNFKGVSLKKDATNSKLNQ
jgi:hypothetical protein